MVYSHAAILDYLLESGQFPDTAAAMQREAGLGLGAASSSSEAAGGSSSSSISGSKGLLEKKWTSVVRLQKKVG